MACAIPSKLYMPFTMQNHTIPVATLADKYGLDTCKRNLEYYLVQHASAAESAGVRYDHMHHDKAQPETVKVRTGKGIELIVSAYLIKTLCQLDMRCAAAALASLCVRILSDASKGNIRACPNHTSKSTAVSAIRSHIEGVLETLANEAAPAAKQIHHHLSRLLLNAVIEQ